MGYLGLSCSLVINFSIYYYAYSVPFSSVHLARLVSVYNNFNNSNPGLPALACYIFAMTLFDLNLTIEAEI